MERFETEHGTLTSLALFFGRKKAERARTIGTDCFCCSIDIYTRRCLCIDRAMHIPSKPWGSRSQVRGHENTG